MSTLERIAAIEAEVCIFRVTNPTNFKMHCIHTNFIKHSCIDTDGSNAKEQSHDGSLRSFKS